MSGNPEKSSRLVEVFQPGVDWVVEDVNESLVEGKVDGKHVLGRVKGQFFAPNGTSRNGRFYPRSLWEKVIRNVDVKNRLTERTMFGTIGHDDTPVTEEQLRNGEVSHIVTNLHIDENGIGLGEAIILDTPSGRNLNTYLRAGSRLSTSSRASGRFAKEPNREGVPIVDEDSYLFETFDFVIEPGFLEARPDLVESLNKPTEVFPMSEANDPIVRDAMKELSESRRLLQEQVMTAQSENGSLKARVEVAESRLKTLESKQEIIAVSEKLGITAEDASRLPRIMEDLQIKDFSGVIRFMEGLSKQDLEVLKDGNISERLNTLKAFQENVAPTPEEANLLAEKATNWITQYRRFGRPNEVAKRIQEGREMSRFFKKHGSPERIEELLTKSAVSLEKFNALGSYKELSEVLEISYKLLSDYKKLGTPRAIREALTKSENALVTVQKLGGLGKIVEALKKYNRLVAKNREDRVSRVSEGLSTEFGVPVDVVRGIVERLGAEDAKKTLAAVSNRRRVNESVGDKPAEGTRTRRVSEGFVGSVFADANRSLNS